MTNQDILASRLYNHNLSRNSFINVADLVKSLGAVQSQDFPGAKWALSQRLNFISNEEIEKEFNEGKFLRTHALRPTWHFVHENDIYWMIELTGQKVKRMMGSYNKALGLDEETFIKTTKLISEILKGKNYQNRTEISKYLISKGIKWSGNGLSHILMWAELDAVICSGPIINKKQTYGLLEERASFVDLTREEAIKKLTEAYFRSHGPAQIKDFSWWSSLNATEIKLGIENNKPLIKSEEIDFKTFYFFEDTTDLIRPEIYLLPNYDEYTIAYSDRQALFENVDHKKLDERQNALFNNVVIINGKVEGLWRRTIKSKAVEVEFRLFKKLSVSEAENLEKVTHKYASFLGLKNISTFI